MSLTAVLIGFAAFFYGLGTWSHRHPPPPSTQNIQDSLEFADRFKVADSGPPIPALSHYLAFIEASGSHGGLIHNYINQGLERLTVALQGLADLNLRVGTVERMQRGLARYGDTLRAHPRWALDPGRVRPALLMSVEIMGSLNLPHDETSRNRIHKAKTEALALESDRSTLWQRSKIQDFFIFTGQALVSLKQSAQKAQAGPNEIGIHGGKPTPPR